MCEFKDCTFALFDGPLPLARLLDFRLPPEVGFQLKRPRNSIDGLATVGRELSEGWDIGAAAGRRLVEGVRLSCTIWRLEDARLPGAVGRELSEGWDICAAAGRRLVEGVRLSCTIWRLEDARLLGAPSSRDSSSMEAASRSRLAVLTTR